MSLSNRQIDTLCEMVRNNILSIKKEAVTRPGADRFDWFVDELEYQENLLRDLEKLLPPEESPFDNNLSPEAQAEFDEAEAAYERMIEDQATGERGKFWEEDQQHD